MSERVRSYGVGAITGAAHDAAAPLGHGRVHGPAVALLETESLARGMVVADALVKRAEVKIAIAEAVTPGKYVLLFYGEVADVEEAYAAGIDVAGASLLDKLILPYAAQGLVDALNGRFDGEERESVGLVETQTIASALLAADVALKRAGVYLRKMQLARGIGGKGFFSISGDLHMVEAAMEAVALAITPPLLLATELIHQPHGEIRRTVL